MKKPLIIAALTLGLAASACGGDTAGSTETNSTPTPTPTVKMDMGTTPEDMKAAEDMKTPEEDMKVDEPDMKADEPDMKVEPDMKPEADMKEPPAPCTTDAECNAPEVCVLDAATGESFCQDPVGMKETGEACADGSECVSGLCLNDACASPCETGADCPNGFNCEAHPVPLEDGSTIDLNVCVEAPEPCLADANCTDPEVCLIDRTGADATLTCGEATGSKDLGESCSMDAECTSGLCLDDVCTKPCERPNDCSTDGSFICDSATVTTGSGQNVTLNVCQPKPAVQCLSDSECVNPERCVATRGAAEITFTCGAPNAGGADNGEACAQDSDCAQNLCIAGLCAGPCQSNGDCASATDYTCELREVMVGGGLDNIQICQPPVTCTSKDECKINEACYVRRDSGVDTICRDANLGGGSLGQVCTQDSECASNLCLEGRFGKVCSLPCADANDCNVTGYECAQASIEDASGSATNLNVCVPATPPSCDSNNDCQTGTTCAVVSNVNGNALESVCIPSTGRLSTGTACAADDDCASRVCLNGSCGAPCEATNECGASQVCSQNSITKSGLSGTFDLCERVQDQACSATSDCTDGVRVCGELRSLPGGDVGAFCRFPITNGAQLGSSCTMDNQCREGICLTTSNECSVGCSQDTDCATAANQICSSFRFSQTSHVDLCVTGCTDNSSCSNGNVCTINPDLSNNDIDQVCEAPLGAKQLGELCSNASECDTGLCLTTFLFDATPCTTDSQCTAGRTCECPVNDPNCTTGKICAETTQKCSRICDDNTDCAGGAAGNTMTSCSNDVSVALPDGNGSKQLSLCGEMN